MNIIEAFKTGRKVKRDTWEVYLTPSAILDTGILPSAVLADDWEVEPASVTLTREDFNKPWARFIKHSESITELRDIIAKELGFE